MHLNWSHRFDFVEWLLLHPGAREVEGAPGWVFTCDGPEDTGGPWYTLHVRNRDDGREFDFRVGVWTRGAGFTYPANWTFDGYVNIELHERYPEEHPDDPAETRDRFFDVPVAILLNGAFDAFVNGDEERFHEMIAEARKALGRDTDEDAA